jgi:hypothetical protein
LLTTVADCQSLISIANAEKEGLAIRVAIRLGSVLLGCRLPYGSV